MLVFVIENNNHGWKSEDIYIFASTFGTFGGLCNTAESLGPLSKLQKGKHGFPNERRKQWKSVSVEFKRKNKNTNF